MDHSYKRGFSFGLTSGIITTLGLMIGLNSGTHSRLAVIGGILTIAIADAFSDAMGIHMSIESENKYKAKKIWQSTMSTFFSKFFFALTFILPVLLFNLQKAIVIGFFWGIFLLSLLSYNIAKQGKQKPWKVISEHLLITIIVVVLTHFVGVWINLTFS